MKKKPRLAFMGSPAFSVPTLDALVDAGYDIVAVYTQRPKPRGRRGLNLEFSPVHERALALNIPVYTPKNFKNEEDVKNFQNLKLDIAIVVAYGLLLPNSILQAPFNGCYNLHTSLLPRWRGAAPIQRAIMAGDKETGAMVMKMDEGFDTGPIFSCTKVLIGEDMTSGELSDILSQKGAILMKDSIDEILQGSKALSLQSEEGVLYANKISKNEAKIFWEKEESKTLQKKICGLSPFPGAYCEMLIKNKWERVKLLKARNISQEERKKYIEPSCKPSGFSQKALKDRLLYVMCADHLFIEILSLQKAGGKILSTKEFLRGSQIEEIRSCHDINS